MLCVFVTVKSVFILGERETVLLLCSNVLDLSVKMARTVQFWEQSVTVLLFHRLIIGFLHKSFKWLTPLLSLQANPIELHACFSFSFVSLLANLKALLSFLIWKTSSRWKAFEKRFSSFQEEIIGVSMKHSNWRLGTWISLIVTFEIEMKLILSVWKSIKINHLCV